MANVKAIRISALVPYNYLDDLDDKEAAWLARWFLSPSVGLAVRYSPSSYTEPHGKGGWTTFYRMEILGREAISYRATDKLELLLQRIGKDVQVKIIDMEA